MLHECRFCFPGCFEKVTKTVHESSISLLSHNPYPVVRVPKDISAEIMKALVVRVSSVIDSQKCTIYSSSWGEAIDSITDLIRVLFHTQSYQ